MARESGGFGDALRTTAVMGALLLGLFFIGRIVTVEPERPASRVELADAVTGAKSMAEFEVLSPTALPDGWIATSARFSPDAWHLGVLTSDNKYIGLEQAAVSAATMVEDFAPDSRPAGAKRIAGQAWQMRTEPDGDRIYVRDVDGTAVLIIGSASRAELEDYVSSLD